jgi:hypothetical protein
MTKKRAIATLAFAAVMLVIAAGAAIVPAGTASNRHSSGNTLAGTWIVTVNLPAPQPPLVSLQSITDDGSFTEWGDDSSGAARSPMYGSWERVEGRLYAASGTFFRFNPQSGAHIGSLKVNRSIRLSADGQSFTAVARAFVLDLSGNVLASFPVTATGERMQVERIAEAP